MAQVPHISEFYKAHEAGRIMMDTDPTGRLVCFRYTEETAAKADWDDVTLNARGIVFDKASELIVARPFTKFFNYHEVFGDHSKVPQTVAAIKHAGLPFGMVSGPVRMMEKIDGSLGIAFYYDGKWMVITPGSFSSPQAIFATDWLNKKLATATDNLPTDFTFLFEITWHKDKHPIKYDHDELVLLAMIERATGEETLSESELKFWANVIGTRTPMFYDFTSIEDVAKICETLPSTKEGFVLTWPNLFKLKMKGTAYLKMLEFYTNCTDKNMWRSYDPVLDIFHAHMDPENGYKFLDDEPLVVPEELPEVLERMELFRKKFKASYDYVMSQGNEIMGKFPDMKSRAIHINTNYPSEVRAPLLKFVSPKCDEVAVKRAVLKTMLRPDENSNTDGFNAFFGYKE